MRILICAALVSLSASAMFAKVDGKIAPFDYRNYPLKSFTQDFAQATGETILISKSIGEDLAKKKLNLTLNAPVNIEEFHSLMISLLKSFGLMLYKEDGFYSIMNERDVRYMPSPIVNSGEVEGKNENYVIAAFKTKFPLSNEISRNLRPFVSRYARVISLSNAKLLLIQDTEKNINSLKEVINVMDTKEAYDAMLEKKKKEARVTKEEKQIKELKEYVERLELDNRMLEKKAQNNGGKK